ASGPGIELLEYLAPAGGRATPLDERANDLVHHQTRLVASGVIPLSIRREGTVLVEDLAQRLNRERYVLISSGLVAIPKAELGFHAALLVRDPDGHPIELVEP